MEMIFNFALDNLDQPNVGKYHRNSFDISRPLGQFWISNWFLNIPEVIQPTYRFFQTKELIDSTTPWFYPIAAITTQPHIWVKKPDLFDIQPEDFFKGISDDAIHGIRDKNGWLVFIQGTECMKLKWKRTPMTFFDFFYESLEYYGIPPRKVIIETGNIFMEYYHNLWCREKRVHEKIHIVSSFYFELAISSKMHKEPNNFISPSEFLESRDIIRPKKFLSFNRVPSAHRVFMVNDLYVNGFFKDGLVSFPGGLKKILIYDDYKRPFIKWRSSEMPARGGGGIMMDFDISEKFANLRPTVDVTKKEIVDTPFGIFNTWPHAQTYLNLVAETHVGEHRLMVTEKTYRAMAYYQPFIMFGPQYLLRTLKEQGYRTFDLDESYDTEPDPPVRMERALDEAKRLLLMSNRDLHEWYWGQQEVLEHNRNLLFSKIMDNGNTVPSKILKIVGG